MRDLRGPDGGSAPARKEPSAADPDHMLDQLGRIAAQQLNVEHYVDDNMRNIP